ncbi:hypothetical protein AB0M22_45365 [Nocardia sp. NPDC051756]|uniref:hypothetical protein n=1 Tax=Nocardia sp. NPDC051756 TaxID=3154751 RepID=UPI00343466DF
MPAALSADTVRTGWAGEIANTGVIRTLGEVTTMPLDSVLGRGAHLRLHRRPPPGSGYCHDHRGRH